MPQQLTDYVISFLRTLAATVAGAVLTWLIAKGVHVDSSLQSPLTEVLFAVLTAAYYAVARLLEQYVSVHFGWLLAIKAKPQYDRTK